MTEGLATERPARRRARVVIAGGGVAALETLLALRPLAGDRVDITLAAPELRFVNRSMAVAQPFSPQRVRGVRLEHVAAEHGAYWHRGALDRVERRRRVVVTKAGDELAYDVLVLALGARAEAEWHFERVLTFRDSRDGAAYRLLLHQLRAGRVKRVAFVKPTGTSWPLPLYDLALMTAAAHPEVELSLVTPEEEPLGMFGAAVGAAIARLLDERRVSVYTSSIGVPARTGRLDVCPGGRRLSFDRIVTEPRLIGPRLRGIPCGRDGFVHTDSHGRVAGLDGVYAAGDATAFPIKHGGLAAQQADAVAEAIAASVGVAVDPQPFRPILRGTLLTGAAPRYLRADVSGRAGDDSTFSSEPLWWPPNKLSGRYLAPYLGCQTGEGSDVMPAPPQRPSSTEPPLERSAS
jgi:sulfide:quinone oxidoreductase